MHQSKKSLLIVHYLSLGSDLVLETNILSVEMGYLTRLMHLLLHHATNTLSVD